MMKRFKQVISEASVLKPDYVIGHKFVWKGIGVKEFENAKYKKGDVFEIVPAPSKLEKVPLIGNEDGAFEKFLKGPDNKVWRMKGSAGYKASSFTHMKSSGSSPSGAEWEDLIVYAYNNLKGSDTDEETVEVAMKYWDHYGSIADEIAKNFDKGLKAKKLVQTGRGMGSIKLGPIWKESGASNKTPKTDIASSNYAEKISLKKSGGSQLASAEKKEAMAIISAALYEMGADKKFANNLINAIDEKMQRLMTTETVTALSKRSKAGEKDKAVIDFQQKDRDNKELSEILESYLNNDTETNSLFSKHVVLEAATGNNKFGSPSSKAAANLLAKFDISSFSVDIKEIKSIKSPIIVEYSTKVKPYVAFKKGSGNSPAYAALRLSLKENKKHDEIGTLRGIVLEELSALPEFSSMINEDFLHEDVMGMLKRAGSWARRAGSALMNKLSVAIKSIVAKIQKALKKIANLGKRMFSSLLRFLGLEISDARGIPGDISL